MGFSETHIASVL